MTHLPLKQTQVVAEKHRAIGTASGHLNVKDSLDQPERRCMKKIFIFLNLHGDFQWQRQAVQVTSG